MLDPINSWADIIKVDIKAQDKFIGHNLEKIGSKKIRAKEEIVVILKPLKCMLDFKSPQTGKISH